ncbi:energy transducer TonB [Wenzhouxiangella sp. XN79A]|uniref:energy transducer TonB n=1 Tax=Wenzhouxiangella sp. XN79A TaxID=2724193 RepID=UPI00144AC430|nr:energy transducer TonB [Wenzhouxiangella sp. XN79A]NKI35658.1 energy transducer TonB [Wenzhouxiangella sp. XN79A]
MAEARERANPEVLTLALLLAVAAHALVLTQLHFDWLDASRGEQAPSLDVILVDSASETAPEEADFLAQANQVGGGDNPDLERPSAPPPSEPAGPPPEPTPEPAQAEAPAETPADEIVAVDDPDVAQPQAPAEEPVEETLPDTQDLLAQTRELATAAPDPLAERRVTPRRPRRKFITASTREHLYAAYMRSWVAKVERVGNMNYPEQARRQGLEGSLVLSVDVLPDGSIERVQVLRSSGHEMLDEAAVRIVRLSAPFSALPPDILAETDILTITRTWQFSASGGLD